MTSSDLLLAQLENNHRTIEALIVEAEVLVAQAQYVLDRTGS